MIKIDRSSPVTLEKTENGKKYVRCDLLADTKEEVIAIGNKGATVEGLDNKTFLTMGSTAFTCSAELGILKSNGTWNF